MSFGVDRGTAERSSDPISVLRAAVDGVLDLDPADLAVSVKGTELIRLRRQMDRLEAAFAMRVQDANRNGVGLEDGHVSTTAWVAWKTGLEQRRVRAITRHAEIAALLPETGRRWREGTIASRAVELIAAARVPGFDGELAAVEAELLERATRGDHKRLKSLTEFFRACARADGS